MEVLVEMNEDLPVLFLVLSNHLTTGAGEVSECRV
jgi:hypothetical protein